MLIHNFLQLSSQNHPEKKAVWYKNNWFSFADVEEKSNFVAAFLIKNGVKRGDRVALLLENSFEYIINYYAILKSGAITVALNNDITSEAIEYLLNDSGAETIITNKKFSKKVFQALKKTPYIRLLISNQDSVEEFKEIGHLNSHSLSSVLNYKLDFHDDVRIIDIDLASIVYTSGSTGKPKGVTLSHLNVVSNTKSIVNYLQLTQNDRVMVVLPFYYIYGKSLLNTHFSVGGSVVLDNRFAFPNKILETMTEQEVSGFSGVPSTFSILLNKSSFKEKSFPSLRYVTQAGGGMAPAVQKEVAEAIKPAKLFIMYGATEASARLSYLNPNYWDAKIGSIGKAIPNVDLFIADELGNAKRQGETGEIVARGSNIMQGYWNDKEETDKVLRNGLYFTGDLGKEDPEGFIYVVGRKKDMIKVGGERISSKEVEEKILEINDVHETAVIGVTDDILGEAVKAYIVPKAGAKLDENEIKNALKDRLPSYKMPKFYEFRDFLPKNESGKIMKTILSKEN